MTRSGGAGRAKPPAARAKPPKTKTQQTNEGRWTDEEHRKFLEAYESMVAVDPARRRWPNVAAALGVEINECRAGIASMARSRRERAFKDYLHRRPSARARRRSAAATPRSTSRAEIKRSCE